MNSYSKNNTLVNELLENISDESPVGKDIDSPVGIDIDGSEEYLKLDMEITKMTPDYEKCSFLAKEILLKQSKDLRVIIYLILSWYRIKKFKGLLNGLEVLLNTLKKFGQDLYPKDHNSKSKAMNLLNREYLIRLLENEQIEDDDVQCIKRIKAILSAILFEWDELFPGYLPDISSFIFKIEQLLQRKEIHSEDSDVEFQPNMAETRVKIDLEPTLTILNDITDKKVTVGYHKSLSNQKKDVLFTAYYPKEIKAATWYSFLVYVHIPSAIKKVELDSKDFLHKMNYDPRRITTKKAIQLKQGITLRIIPDTKGVIFNPPELYLIWIEDYHLAHFRFCADKDLIDQACIGDISVYIGPLEISNIPFSIFVMDPTTKSSDKVKLDLIKENTQMYRRIFASYSHRDIDIVNACVTAFKAIGDEVYIDYDTLRSGDDWQKTLEALISSADIFQLFWSKNASQSQYVRRELRIALKKAAKQLKKLHTNQNFIRPVFWEKPIHEIPTELKHLHFKFISEIALVKQFNTNY